MAWVEARLFCTVWPELVEWQPYVGEVTFGCALESMGVGATLCKMAQASALGLAAAACAEDQASLDRARCCWHVLCTSASFWRVSCCCSSAGKIIRRHWPLMLHSLLMACILYIRP